LHADAVARAEAFEPVTTPARVGRQRTLAFLADHPDGLDPTCRPGHVTATAVVLSADRTQTLLTLHRRVGRWLGLGGHVEPGDADIPAAARREATEESGIDGLVVDSRLLTISAFDDVPCRRSPGATHFDLVYLVTAPAGSRPERSDESLDLGWFDVERLPEPLGDEVAEHVLLARHSRAGA